jgi:hypothetical protein
MFQIISFANMLKNSCFFFIFSQLFRELHLIFKISFATCSPEEFAANIPFPVNFDTNPAASPAK